MKINLNGKPIEVTPQATLAEIPDLLAIAPDRLALELNGDIVSKDRWGQTTLHPNDSVEAVTFVGGG